MGTFLLFGIIGAVFLLWAVNILKEYERADICKLLGSINIIDPKKNKIIPTTPNTP